MLLYVIVQHVDDDPAQVVGVDRRRLSKGASQERCCIFRLSGAETKLPDARLTNSQPHNFGLMTFERCKVHRSTVIFAPQTSSPPYPNSIHLSIPPTVAVRRVAVSSIHTHPSLCAYNESSPSQKSVITTTSNHKTSSPLHHKSHFAFVSRRPFVSHNRMTFEPKLNDSGAATTFYSMFH